MIDLHMHTSLSDGACSIEEVLELASKSGLNYISITDHNHALAYEDENLSKLAAFKGHVVRGCEIATSYMGYIIEILGYGINADIINSWYREVYNEQNLAKNEIRLFNKLKQLCIKENLKLDDNLQLGEIKKGCSKKIVFENLIRFEENKDVLELNSYRKFLRLMLSNPMHPLFLNEAETYPMLDEVVDLIHRAEGKAFLAHPFEYGFEDTIKALEEIVKLAPLDGIECFHPSSIMENSSKLMSFCKEHTLYASGGSDFHNFIRNTSVGLSSGNAPIYDEIIIPWINENMMIKGSNFN